MTSVKRAGPGRDPGTGSEISGGDQQTRGHGSTGRLWDSTTVAVLVELAYSTAVHQARVAPVEVVEREVQPFDERVARTVRVLERRAA